MNKKVRVKMSANAEIVVHVTDKMVSDYQECKRMANVPGGPGKDCYACSLNTWKDFETDLCELSEVVEAIGKIIPSEKKEQDRQQASEKLWSDMTDTDIYRLKQQQCAKCFYYSQGSSSAKATGTCEYMKIEGHRRGCSPLKCKENGLFKPKGKGKVECKD